MEWTAAWRPGVAIAVSGGAMASATRSSTCWMAPQLMGTPSPEAHNVCPIRRPGPSGPAPALRSALTRGPEPGACAAGTCAFLQRPQGVTSIALGGHAITGGVWEGGVSATVVCPHAHRSGRTSWTVGGDKSPWRWPRGPGCPPALRDVVVVVRWRGFLDGESEDGGRWEVVECCVRRASHPSTRARSCVSSSGRLCT
jgi:hypothetical protein